MNSSKSYFGRLNFKQKIHSVVFYLLFIGGTFFFSSCATYYIPNTQNVPLFEEKNQGTVMAGAEVGEFSTGFDIQVAYSITNHFAVFGNGYLGTVSNSNSVSASNETNNFNVGELGAGYFTKLGDSRGIFEVYGGWGIGGARWDEKALTDLYRYNHFFIQPNIGGHLGPVDVAFSTRLNYSVWSDFTELFIEPALTFRTGWDKFKFQVQFSGSISTTGDPFLPSQFSGDVGYAETIHTSWGFFVPLDFN